MFNIHDLSRNEMMLTGPFARKGYDWWWHSFTAIHESTGEEKPFFIEYFLCNPARAQEAPVLGQLTANRQEKRPPSYLMVKAGCWGKDRCQLHRFFAWKDVDIQAGWPYQIIAGDCFASEKLLQGSVSLSDAEAAAHPEYMCDPGSISWKLQVNKKIAFNVGYGASKFLRKIKAFEMYWHAEGMKTEYAGEIVFNGEKYIVKPESSYGYSDKNWGRNFTSPWLWLSSCCLKSDLTGKRLENSVFDIGGGKPKVYFLPLNRKLLGAFYYEGAEFEFNFSKFWTLPRTKFSAHETDDEIVWHVQQENRKSVMITDIRCKKDDMLLINYEAPDGQKRHNRLWNGGNGVGRIQLYLKQGKRRMLVDDIEATHIGCEYGEYDR